MGHSSALRSGAARGPIGAMVELRQGRWSARGAPRGAAMCFVCAGMTVSACRSHGTTPLAVDAAAPAQKDAAAGRDAGPEQGPRNPEKEDAQPPKAPAPPSKLHRIGETASAKDFRFRVEHIKRCETEPYFRPRPGNVKLGVEVEVETTGATALMVNPFYAWVHDAHGRNYYFTLAGCEPALQATRLEPAQTAEGWLTFEVPESANDLELSYGPPTSSGAPAEVRFSLERE
jgi:hypothetical protein